MTINQSDIKLLESERMTDASDGGGRRTSRVIVDGTPGNIFPKVSRLDSVYGRVNLRKIYGTVDTENVDTLAGAHFLITDAPDNNKIHATMFSTGSDFDNRTAARDRIESYVVAGPESRMVLYGRQLVGQQALLVYQRVEEPLPEVGEVYCLSKEAGAITYYQQFCRVTDISDEVRTFTDSSGDFSKRVITMKIGAPLRYEFRGPDTPSRQTSVTRDALVRATTVADASRYFGIQKLSEAADEDALDIRVASVFTPIVPTTLRESPISLASIGGAGGYISASAARSVERIGSHSGSSATYSLFTTRSIRPGSLILKASDGSTIATDDGNGVMVTSAGTAFPISAGTVDYQSGRIGFSLGNTGSTTFDADYLPSVEVSDPARTKEIEISLGNRGTVYSEVLNPIPNPGSVIVDYRALGKWYRLRDDGNGQVTANDPAFGVGSIDYVTGALILTLGALPDVESSITISWGSTIDYTVRAGGTQDIATTTFDQTFTLAHLPVEPGSLELSFVCDGVSYTASANVGGVVSGNGVNGKVIHETGVVTLAYTVRKPDVGSIVTADYNQLLEDDPGAPVTVTENLDIALSTPYTLSEVPVREGSFAMQVSATATLYGIASSGSISIADDGLGQLKTVAAVFGVSAYGSLATVPADVTVGSIDYDTGEVELSTLSVTLNLKVYVNDALTSYWGPTTATATIRTDVQGSSIYSCTAGSAVQTARTDEFDAAEHPVWVDLTRTTAEPVVPGSVWFSLTGSSSAQFFDRNGVIYTALNHVTGSASVAGTIDYNTGRAYLTAGHDVGMSGSTPVSISVISCLTQIGDFSATEAFFRTAGSPIRPGSVYVQASALDGTLISGTSDDSGNITGTKIRGTVVQEMGVVRVEFGQMSGGDWVPIEIAPSTLRYSAVVLSNLPLNADILGLDPVRLPSDGRVPIYRPADVVVIHNTKSYELPNPAEADETYSVGRTDLYDLWLVDDNGARVATSKYTFDLAAGTVTMAADLDLTGLPQPLVARHRIAEMNMLSDVQINGQMSLTSALTRDFDATDTWVSSALLFGDLYSRYTNLFDQASWTGAWSDEQIGSGATAQYNDIDYPVEILNNGAVTERWRISFTSTTAFQVIGENLGVIATGNTSSDCAPVNGLTGEPYFVIRSGGWGSGWATGNQVRFNTVAASAPVWMARTILPGATLNGDSIDIQLRGDVDA